MSAPIHVLGSSAAISTGNGATLAIDLPDTARPGNLLVAMLSWPDALVEPDFAAAGWTGIAYFAHGKVAMLTRIVDDDTPRLFTFAFTGAITAGFQPPMGALLAMGNVATADPNSSTEFLAAGPDIGTAGWVVFNIPTFIDGALLLFVANDAGGFNAHASQVAAVNGSDGVAHGSLIVLLVKPEAAGNMPNQTVTLTSGNAAANGSKLIGLVTSEQVDTAAQLTKMDPPGSIGLPWVGA